jgi:hypothetical protein
MIFADDGRNIYVLRYDWLAHPPRKCHPLEQFPSRDGGTLGIDHRHPTFSVTRTLGPFLPRSEVSIDSLTALTL